MKVEPSTEEEKEARSGRERRRRRDSGDRLGRDRTRVKTEEREKSRRSEEPKPSRREELFEKEETKEEKDRAVATDPAGFGLRPTSKPSPSEPRAEGEAGSEETEDVEVEEAAAASTSAAGAEEAPGPVEHHEESEEDLARPAAEGPPGDGWVAASEVDLRTLQEMKAVHIQGRYWDNEAEIVGEITKTLMGEDGAWTTVRVHGTSTESILKYISGQAKKELQVHLCDSPLFYNDMGGHYAPCRQDQGRGVRGSAMEPELRDLSSRVGERRARGPEERSRGARQRKRRSPEGREGKEGSPGRIGRRRRGPKGREDQGEEKGEEEVEEGPRQGGWHQVRRGPLRHDGARSKRGDSAEVTPQGQEAGQALPEQEGFVRNVIVQREQRFQPNGGGGSAGGTVHTPDGDTANLAALSWRPYSNYGVGGPAHYDAFSSGLHSRRRRRRE